MPRATDDLCAKFPEDTAHDLVVSRGWVLGADFTYRHPDPAHVEDDDESDALDFLFQEDFGVESK